jgi:hypothetical protein
VTKLSDCRTAEEIHRDAMKNWSYRWRYWLGWPKNQIEIRRLKKQARRETGDG